MIYLDNASTTSISPQVLDAMLPFLQDLYGNPGSIHALGRYSAEAVETAREQIAGFLHAKPEQIIFTSGGTESNNLAFRSALYAGSCPRIVTSAVEHDSIRSTLREFLLHSGMNESVVYPDNSGSITAENIRSCFNTLPDLVSVMYMNNETGAVNEVPEIGALCRMHGVLFHTDCVQAAGAMELDVNKMYCDFLSLSSHKLHGPKGVGALFVRDRVTLRPLICGGADQEFGLRGGTENVAGIVGFGMACEIAGRDLKANSVHTSTLKQIFWHRLCECLAERNLSDTVRINGPAAIKPGKILNILADGVDAETLVLLMDSRGVCISTGSACRSHEQEPSRVLLAMGLTEEQAHNSVRVSFSDQNTFDEATQAAEIMAQCITFIKAQ